MPELVMSEEVKLLTQSHLEYLLNSGISIDIIRDRGYKSIFGRADPELVAAGFTKSQISAPGILIPLYRPDGTNGAYQYRPDNPKTDNNHKKIKYVSPSGATNILDTPLCCRDMIGDPSVPLWITEGAKKADAGASVGLCIINCNGVWGWKGRNKHGATVVNDEDLDRIALKSRRVVLAFDADAASNKLVRMALLRLSSHLKRKGANVEYCILPNDEIGDKIGIDDYLAAGHTVEDLNRLVVGDLPEFVEPEPEDYQVISHQYIVHDGRLCWFHNKRDQGKVIDPLCNFTAKITEKVIHDDGTDERAYFVVSGHLYNGAVLPPITVALNEFNNMNWILEKWGGDARPAPGQGLRDHLRDAILSTAEGKVPRMVLGHTGWREISGKMVFAMPTGSIGSDEVEVDITPIDGYGLPEDLSIVEPEAAMRRSLAFLDICDRPEVTYPLWAIMYSAPLGEIIKHDFILWYLAHTGAKKSTIQAQALCHFGQFDYDSLPLSWTTGSTYKGLMKSLSVLKDIVSCLDDWAPGATAQQQNNLENMAERISRAVGNKAKQTKLQSDGMIARTYRPRGAVISSGEQLPGGESRNARLFVVDLHPNDIDLDRINLAISDREDYPYAMANYLKWLSNGWDRITSEITQLWHDWRIQLGSQQMHSRLPGAVATLYSGLYLATKYAVECNAISQEKAEEIRGTGWNTLVRLSTKHATTINEERPGNRFLDGIRTFYNQGWLEFQPIDSIESKILAPPRIYAGWYDNEYFYLIPDIVFNAVKDHLNRSSPFTYKPKAVWADMQFLGYINCKDSDRLRTKMWFGSIGSRKQQYVIPIKISTIVEYED